MLYSYCKSNLSTIITGWTGQSVWTWCIVAFLVKFSELKLENRCDGTTKECGCHAHALDTGQSGHGAIATYIRSEWPVSAIRNRWTSRWPNMNFLWSTVRKLLTTNAFRYCPIRPAFMIKASPDPTPPNMSILWSTLQKLLTSDTFRYLSVRLDRVYRKASPTPPAHQI